MPKISSGNSRFRTKDRLCSDISFVLNSELHYGTKFAVLSEATWVWTEYDGKYQGCKYWSMAAWEIKDQQKMLRHEHIIPKSLVIKRLIELKPATPEQVEQVMTFYCIGAVVTKDEDALLSSHGLRSKMPTGCDEKDVWARYKQAGIVLRDDVS